MARGKGHKDVAPQIRGAFKRAVRMLEDDGKPLSLLIKEHLESDFVPTLKAISSFCPKELEVDVGEGLAEYFRERERLRAAGVLGLDGGDAGVGEDAGDVRH